MNKYMKKFREKRYFSGVVEIFSSEELLKLLLLVTGESQMTCPIEPFIPRRADRSLSGCNWPELWSQPFPQKGWLAFNLLWLKGCRWMGLWSLSFPQKDWQNFD